MLRALILAALICASCGMVPSMPAETLTVNRRPTTVININDATSAATTTTTATSTTTTTNNMNMTPPSTNAASTDQVIDSNHNNNNINNVSYNEEKQKNLYYHPAEDKKPRVVEEFSRHFLDGSYEYKYVLSNGVTRYEKSYWKPVGNNKKLLARKGFYSHPLTNRKYLTVFYTADENGYQQDTAKYTNGVPTLPRHLDIPQLQIPQATTTSIIKTTTRKPKTTTTTTTRKTTTRKPKTTTTTTTWRPIVEPSEFNWIY